MMTFREYLLAREGWMANVAGGLGGLASGKGFTTGWNTAAHTGYKSAAQQMTPQQKGRYGSPTPEQTQDGQQLRQGLQALADATGRIKDQNLKSALDQVYKTYYLPNMFAVVRKWLGLPENPRGS
jgi:hypothetical protein